MLPIKAAAKGASAAVLNVSRTTLVSQTGRSVPEPIIPAISKTSHALAASRQEAQRTSSRLYRPKIEATFLTQVVHRSWSQRKFHEKVLEWEKVYIVDGPYDIDILNWVRRVVNKMDEDSFVKFLKNFDCIMSCFAKARYTRDDVYQEKVERYTALRHLYHFLTKNELSSRIDREADWIMGHLDQTWDAQKNSFLVEKTCSVKDPLSQIEP